MATMNISLPKSMKEFVEKQAAAEGFQTVSEYLRAIIRSLQKQHTFQQSLEDKLVEGLRSPLIEATDPFWRNLEARAAVPKRERK